MRIALIAKPPPGGKKKRERVISSVMEQLFRNQIKCTLFKTRYHGHATKIVQDLSLKEFDALVAMGGDGTNYHVLNGLLKYHSPLTFPALGIIPMGRGNSFAKDLNIHSITDGINAIIGQHTVAVDVCRFIQPDEHYYFVNLMGFGFVTDVAQTATRFSWAGDLSYVIGVFQRTLGLKFHDMALEIDGKAYGGPNCFVEFCNSRYTGGNMLMAPDAKIDDGYFDAVILSPLTRRSLLRVFPKIFNGTHIHHPQVRVVRGRHAVVRSVPTKGLLPDGEFFGQTPTTIDVLPKKLRYFA